MANASLEMHLRCIDVRLGGGELQSVSAGSRQYPDISGYKFLYVNRV